MTRPTVRIGGQDQTGRVSPKEPEFSDALAYWKCDDSPFHDSNSNALDFAGVLGTQQIHPLFGGKLWRGYEVSSVSLADALLRITGDVTLHFLMGTTAPAARFDLQCYSTGDTDCLYGVGYSGGNFRIWDKSLSGGVQFPLKNFHVIQTPYGREITQVWAVREGTNWKFYAQGKLLATVAGASTNTPVGDEVFVISSTSVNHSFSHVAIWNSALSAARIEAEYKRTFGR